MYNKKLILTVAILIALLGFATAQMKADIPIVQADTIFQGFGGGSVSGIVFGPTGETVIVMHNAKPVEIDIKTKQVVREFEVVPNLTGGGGDMFTVKENSWLVAFVRSSDFYGKKDFFGNVVWDMVTGKIIKNIYGIKLLAENNKDKYYFYYNDISEKEYLGKFDINTFKMVDSIYLPKSISGSGYAEWSSLSIIPNSNKVLVGVQRYTENEQGNKTYLLSELYLLDFDTKKYTKIPIPYEAGQKSSEITNITVSETGKYNIVAINIYGSGNYYYVFDREFKFIFKENEFNIRKKTNEPNLGLADNICFLEDRYFTVSIETRAGLYQTLFYDLDQMTPLKIINFHDYAATYRNNSLILLSYYGPLGSQTLTALPVIENKSKITTIRTIQLQNTNLVVTTNTTEVADINITDYAGNILLVKKDVPLRIGENKIQINSPMQSGAYFCVIKTQNTTDTYKFMVNN